MSVGVQLKAELEIRAVGLFSVAFGGAFPHETTVLKKRSVPEKVAATMIDQHTHCQTLTPLSLNSAAMTDLSRSLPQQGGD